MPTLLEASSRPVVQSNDELEGSAEPKRRPFGIQLYAVRDAMQADFNGTLAAIAAMGYTEVELAGLYGHSTFEWKTALAKAGLKAPSAHVPVEALTDKLDQTIADAKALGHEMVILPWVGEEYRGADGYRRLADLLNKAGKKLRAAELRLGYHNHDFEFGHVELPDYAGIRCGYDALLFLTERKYVSFELDLFWIRKAGANAMKYFGEHQGRFRAVHVKDMAEDGTMVDVGKGVMDWAGLLRAARKAGATHWFAEHDEAKDQLAFARTSAAYLKKLVF